MPDMFDVAPDYGVTGVFEVGGHVRDQLLGLESKDIDYAVEATSYQHMVDWIHATHEDVFLEKPEFATVRALLRKGEPRDYVLCRKDGAYFDARRPDSIERGTIYDDLARRDFTVNAIARNVQTGEILDPHHGVSDLKAMRLRCVGSADVRFEEDTLRIVRAVRFMATKFFSADKQIREILSGEDHRPEFWVQRMDELPVHRRFEEIEKMFKYHTPQAITVLERGVHVHLRHSILDGIWMQPRTKEKR